MGSSDISKRLEWQPGEHGHVVYDKRTDSEFVRIAVVHVLDYRLNCGPLGNFQDVGAGKIEKAKYQLYGGRPRDASFGEDFLHLYHILNTLQIDAAATLLRQDMLFDGTGGKMVHFATNIKRVRTNWNCSCVDST